MNLVEKSICPDSEIQWASPVAQTVKNLPVTQETWVQFLGRKDPLEKGWQLTPVFFPGEFYGQRSLAGYSPQGCKELDMIERLTLSFKIEKTLF